MTAFARKVLGGLPAPNLAGAANNYSIAQEFTNDTDKAGGKIDLQVEPDAVDVRPLRLARASTPTISRRFRCPRAAAATATSTRATSSSSLGTTYVAERSIAARSPLRLVEHRRAARTRRRSARRDSFGISGLPTDPRIAGGLPSQSITGYSAFGRQATNPQWQFPTVWNPKINYTWLMGRQSLKAGYEFQHIDVEVQDVNPLYGLDTYTGQFTRPAGAAANNLYNLADFMLGLRSQYALSTFLVAQMRQNLHFTYLQDDIRVNDKLTLNVGLRYEYATPMWEANNVLTNFDPATQTMVSGQGRIDLRSRAGRSRSQQLRPAPRLRVHADAEDRRPRRLGHQLRARQPHRLGEPARHQRPAGRPRRRHPDDPTAAGVPRRPSRAIRPASPTRRSSIR